MLRLATDSASIGQSIHRFEVITGDPVRRSHEDDFKVEFVLRSMEPDVCVADVARAQGIYPQLLYSWRRQAKLGTRDDRESGPLRLASCWAHARRKLHEIAEKGTTVSEPTYCSQSSPSPPSRMSSPAPPRTVSLPAPPRISSSPARPTQWLFSASPVSVSS